MTPGLNGRQVSKKISEVGDLKANVNFACFQAILAQHVE